MLDCGAIEIVNKFTVRHLALSMNIIVFLKEVVINNVKETFLEVRQGPNVQRMLENKMGDLYKQLETHMNAISEKFVSIISDSIKPAIESGCKTVDWDAAFDV